MNEFLEQLPIAAFASFCGVVFVAIVLLLAIAVVMRRNRSSAEERSSPKTQANAPTPNPLSSRESAEPLMFDPDEGEESYDAGALPDLLDLLHPSSITAQSLTPPARDMKSVFNVLRDETEDRLVLQMDGVTYRTLVDEPEVRRKFIAIVKELSEVVNKPYEPSAFTDDKVHEPDAGYDNAVDVPPAPSKLANDDQVQSRVPSQSGGEIPGALPSYNLEDSSTLKQGRFGRTKYEPKPIPELNIAAAIEDYLQFKLAQTPAYITREIHVHNAPGGFVRIQVDDRYYDEVGQVEDEEIRTFLSNTIQEWQQNQQR